MMRAAIEKFKDIHFYRFGKPVHGVEDNTCDMAWRFRPKEGTTSLYKDYQRFVISKTKNCSLTISDVGEYHSGINARKKKTKSKLSLKSKLSKVKWLLYKYLGRW